MAKSENSLMNALNATTTDAQIRELTDRSDLSEQSAAIVVHAANGKDAAEIADHLGRAPHYVQMRLDDLRARKHSLNDEIDALKTTQAALNEL